MKHARRRFDEAGESLAELLVAIAILGIAIAVITGGLGDAIFASNEHRNYATAGTVARNGAEAIKDRKLAWNASGNYTLPASNGVTPTVTARCWNGDSPATFAGCPNNDRGLQQLTVTATSRGTTESVTVLKRRN
jgi:type II secretory pathway pseudopilin PulG